TGSPHRPPPRGFPLAMRSLVVVAQQFSNLYYIIVSLRYSDLSTSSGLCPRAVRRVPSDIPPKSGGRTQPKSLLRVMVLTIALVIRFRSPCEVVEPNAEAMRLAFGSRNGG